MMNGQLAFEAEPIQRPLRAYQAEAIERLKASLRSGHRRPVLQAPTGYGKTRLAAEIVNNALRKGKRVVFTVPALSLISQTLEAFYRDGVRNMGVIQADHRETDWSRPVQIASVQTLARRPYPKADLVIVDECHTMFSFYEKWMTDPEWQKIPFIGLSATPWSKGLVKWYDDLIISATTEDLIEQGWLAPFRVFAPGHPDLSRVATVAGDYHEGQLSEVMNTEPLVGDVVQTWLKRGDNRPTLCFGVDCAHALNLHKQFEAAGVRSAYIDAYTEAAERKIIGDKLAAGKIQVVCNIGTLTTGIDWDVRCIILARPTKSEILFVQIVGRGLRTALGKQDLLILDHASIHIGAKHSLGFVTDIYHDELHDGSRKEADAKRKPLPKECPKCAFLRAPGIRVCPNCGFKPEPVSTTQHADGQLVEVTRQKPKDAKEARLHRAGLVAIGAVEIRLGDFYAQLKHYAQTHGYKPGWAANKYRQKTNTWPNHYRDVPSMQPCAEVASWIKAMNIRWAKSHPRDGARA